MATLSMIKTRSFNFATAGNLMQLCNIVVVIEYSVDPDSTSVLKLLWLRSQLKDHTCPFTGSLGLQLFSYDYFCKANGLIGRNR
ncbi:unnamed protein product [Parnassius mnemosyne]|uniref:Uncharacterized protein n=1 Tax=Parnassius mnemosyne TaxID=213953 RepID=A0AAV1KSE4_9NEOP